MELLHTTPDDKVLEVGIANKEYSEFDNFVIKNYQWPAKITALGLGDVSHFRQMYPAIPTVSYDGRVLPFSDKEFDVAHSNAVIEHVGGPGAQELFLKELERVARRCMITTPNRYFPIETHTRVPLLHWMSKDLFDSFIKLIGKSWAAGNYMHLLGEKDLDLLAKRAGLRGYRIIKNRLAGLPMTFTLVWPMDGK